MSDRLTLATIASAAILFAVPALAVDCAVSRSAGYEFTTEALYLDGSISSLHAPGLRRSDAHARLGPMFAVVE